MDDYYIKKILGGDISSFKYFIKEHKDMAFTLAMSIVKDDYKAQEVVQDSFIRAFQHLKSFNQKSSFKTWLYRIVVNESFRHLKKMKRKLFNFKMNIMKMRWMRALI